MKELGLGLHWDDFKVGDRFKTVGRTIFESDIVNFCGVVGLQEVLFNNLEYIEKESPTGQRIAPGSLVFCLAESTLINSFLQKTGLAFLGMEFNIKGPVVVGDTIHVEFEVIEARATSKGDRGLVRTRNDIKNQRGETVIEYTPLRLMKGRG